MINRDYQPTTIDPNRLLIGIASVAVDAEDLGAVANASIEIASVTKERYIGYPANRSETITESISAQVSITAEELGSVPVLLILSNLLEDLNREIATSYVITMQAPFAGGGNLQLESTVKLLPELTLDFQDDWNAITYKFECIGSNSQTLVHKSLNTDVRKPATTVNKSNLSIGKPKLEIFGQSVGAIQRASLSLNGTVKRVEAGYPKCVKDIIYLNSVFELQVVTEETELLPVADCVVKLTLAIADNGFISLEFPHCAILEDLSYSPQNTWTGRGYKIKPFKPAITDTLVNLVRG